MHPITYLKARLGLQSLPDELRAISEKISDEKILLGKLLVNQLKQSGTKYSLADVEFKIFSQFGDDGIIQYLIHQIGLDKSEFKFIEFGVQNYEESNTRFLLINNNWSGLVIDGGESNINHIKNSSIFWRHNLKALCAFITKDNINALIQSQGFSGDIGILSVDIDGNDYWVWEKISVINPVIVITEYNSVFGKDNAITIPYDPDFYRTKAHYSNLYWGASLKAMSKLAEEKGYSLVGSNSAGNNAYFVRNDRLGGLKAKATEEVYVESKFRESRDERGLLSYIDCDKRLDLIKDMPVYCLERNKKLLISEL